MKNAATDALSQNKDLALCPTIPPVYELDFENKRSHNTSITLPAIPGYSIGKMIGEGGMGVVYEATQLAISRRCAIKFLLPNYAKNKHFAARFKREAQVMARLQDPHIVQVLEFGESEDMLYLIMIYIVGPNGTAYDLRQHLAKQGGRLTESEVVTIVDQIASALETAHHEGIVHRDVKPGNVLLDARKRAYVTDFGLSMDRESQFSEHGMMMGTINYMAPEQHQGIHVDHRADIYSLTVITYELLTGRLPLGNFKPVTQLVPGLQKHWDILIAQGLATDPNDRLDNATRFREMLGTIAGHASKALLLIESTGDGHSSEADKARLVTKDESSATLLSKAKEQIQLASKPGQADIRWRNAESAFINLERLFQSGNSNNEIKQLRDTADELSRRWAKQALTEACQSKNGSLILNWSQRLLDIDPEDNQANKVIKNIRQQYQHLRADLQKAQEQRQLLRMEKITDHLLSTFPDDPEVQRIAVNFKREREDVEQLLRNLKNQIQAKQWCGVQASLEQLSHRQIRIQQADSLKMKARTAIQQAKGLVVRAKKQLASKHLHQAARLLTDALNICPDCLEALELEADLRHEQSTFNSENTKLTDLIEKERWRKAERHWNQFEQSLPSGEEKRQLRKCIQEGVALARTKLSLQVISIAGLALILVLILGATYPASLVFNAVVSTENNSLKKLNLPILTHQFLAIMGLWAGLHFLYYRLRGAWPRKSDMSFVLIFLIVPTCHLVPTFMDLEAETREFIRMVSLMSMVSLTILSLSQASVGSIFLQTILCVVVLLTMKGLGYYFFNDGILLPSITSYSTDHLKHFAIYGFLLIIPTFMFWSADDWRKRRVLPKVCCTLILLCSFVLIVKSFPGKTNSIPWIAMVLTGVVITVGLAIYDIFLNRRPPSIISIFTNMLIVIYACLPCIIVEWIRVGYIALSNRNPVVDELFDHEYRMSFTSTFMLPWWCTWACLVLHQRRLASTPGGWVDLLGSDHKSSVTRISENIAEQRHD